MKLVDLLTDPSLVSVARTSSLTELLMIIDIRLCSTSIDRDKMSDFCSVLIEVNDLLQGSRSNWSLPNPTVFDGDLLKSRLHTLAADKLSKLQENRYAVYLKYRKDLCDIVKANY